MDIDTNEIKLFTKNETNFDHNGKILNEATSCFVTESLDGIFDLDLEYPLNDKKQLSGDLVRENIIKSVFSQTDSRGEQLFTVRKRSLNTKNNRINIYAQAKARRDLDMNMVLGLEVPAGTNRKIACGMLLNKCVEQKGYTIGNLDTNTNTNINLGLEEETGNVINYLAVSGISALKAFLSDSENSIYKAYGGEIIYNNFEINMVDERGTDNNILIESGKNLEELQQDIDDLDTENFATAVLPCSADGVYLPNSEIIYSPNAATLGKIFKKVVYDDVTLVSETPEAFEVVYAQLRERVQKDFDNGLDKLKINNTIKYIQLLNTEEYKPYAKLFTEKCEIGNNVTVRYYMTNDKTKYIDAVGRVVKIKFNVLKNRIEEIEIGDRKKKSVLDVITSTTSNVTTVNDKTNKNTDKIKKVKKYATDITNNLQVVMEAKDNEIELSVTNLADNTTAQFLIQDGKISEKVSNDTFNSYRIQTADEIAQKVSTGDFGSLIQQNANSIVNAIEGVTDNKTTLDSSGFHVSGGAFDFAGYNGNMLIEAVSDGSIDAIRIGDSSWSKSRTFSHVLLGGLPLDQYLLLSCIAIDSELDMIDNNIYTEGTIYSTDLEVSGTKNCVQDTQNYGKRLINAYETAEYYFGDLGESTIDETGKCIINIEDIFKECVNTDVKYHFFYSCYNGSVSKVERFADRIEVYGEANTIFSYEIKAKRRGYENNRLELSKRQQI